MMFARVDLNQLAAIFAKLFSILFGVHAVSAGIGEDLQEVVHRMFGGQLLAVLDDCGKKIVARWR
jgi:hypothetical protein